MESNKLKLTAGIFNLGKEVEIYDWLALIAGDYGTKPFNKRFETWLNKQSAERFGTHIVEDWGGAGKHKEFENVRFGFSKKDWGDGYELNFYYKGQQVRYDYDAKQAFLGDSNEREGLVSVKDIAEIVDWSKKSSANRAMEREKAQGNLEDIAKLTAERDRLQQQISEHNDRISYLLSDELRIRAR